MTFADKMLNAADDNGQISYAAALFAAAQHGLTRAFVNEYGSADRWVSCGVDAGELLVWLGY